MKRFADLLGTTKSWMLGHKLRAVILALVLVFTAPWPARAQIISPCCALLVAGLSSIQSALTKVVGGGLNGHTVQRAAAKALGSIGPPAKDAIPALLQFGQQDKHLFNAPVFAK